MDKEALPLVFVGIDHGTTAVRVAIMEWHERAYPRTIELLKSEGKMEFIKTLEEKVPLDEIKLIAVSYSMGDAISAITPIERVKNRGVRSLDDVGPYTGYGTKMYDEVKESGLPAVVLPGLHDGCDWLDPRLTTLQSHIASPKKAAASIYCYDRLTQRREPHYMVVSNISSNTVSILINDSQIVGGIDAVLGAPGLRHGPLDVESMRQIDSSKMTANEAFSSAGILSEPYGTPEKLLQGFKEGRKDACLRLDSLVLAVAMEILSLRALTGDIDTVAVTGSLGEVTEPINIGKDVGELIGMKVHTFTRFSAAIGAAIIAGYVHRGATIPFGIPVDKD